MKISSSVKLSAQMALVLAARYRPGARRHPAAAPARRVDRLQRRLELRARSRPRSACASGGRRMTTSREEPKFCTCGSWKPAAVSCAAHLVDVGRLGEAHLRAHATREVDAEIQAAGEERDERGDHQHGRERVPHLACGHERVAGLVAEKFHACFLRSVGSRASLRRPPYMSVMQRAAAHEGGEHGGRDAEGQHDRETRGWDRCRTPTAPRPRSGS